MSFKYSYMILFVTAIIMTLMRKCCRILFTNRSIWHHSLSLLETPYHLSIDLNSTDNLNQYINYNKTSFCNQSQATSVVFCSLLRKSGLKHLGSYPAICYICATMTALCHPHKVWGCYKVQQPNDFTKKILGSAPSSFQKDSQRLWIPTLDICIHLQNTSYRLCM